LLAISAEFNGVIRLFLRGRRGFVAILDPPEYRLHNRRCHNNCGYFDER
jgi:hypothetical protein